MTRTEWTRRVDLKTSDIDRNLSPLDKDQLKQRCLARVRSERSRNMARIRQRRNLAGKGEFDGDPAALTPGTNTAHADARTSSRGTLLSCPREILRQELEVMSTDRRRRAERRQELPLLMSRDEVGLPGGAERILVGEYPCKGQSSALRAIEEEAAYRQACSPAEQRKTRPEQRDALTPDTRYVAERDQCIDERREGQERYAMESDHDAWQAEDELGHDEHLLSPDEYLEMMQYIEEACKGEEMAVEAEALEEYELTRRFEEEAMEYTIRSSQLEDSNAQGAVLCPACHRDYLVQAGPPSVSIVCSCGFRLNTGGDRLGLEHLRQQLAETYDQHSECTGRLHFVMEGPAGSDILWSYCDSCNFARVVM